MANYSAGSATVTIKPDMGSFQRDLKADLERIKQKFGVDVTADLTRLEAELKTWSETHDFTVDAKIRPNFDEFQAELAAWQATHNPTVTVGVDLDTAGAEAQLDAFTRDRRVTVGVDVDKSNTSTAISELFKPAERKKVTVDVETSGLAETLGGLTLIPRRIRTKVAVKSVGLALLQARIRQATRQRVATIRTRLTGEGSVFARLAALARPRIAMIIAHVQTLGASRGVQTLTRLMGGLTMGITKVGAVAGLIGIVGTAAMGAVPPLVVLIQQVLNLGNALITLPALATAGIAGIGAMGLGVLGLGKAFGAMGQQAAGGGAAAAGAADQTAKAIEQANRQVEQATRGVRDAEHSLKEAHDETKRAQEELTRARKDAVENLEELNQKLKDTALDEEGAALAVARAKQRLQKTQADPKSSTLDIQEADLAYRRSIVTLQKTRDERVKLGEEAATAAQKGVDGADNVVAASKRVESAQWQEMKAYEGMEDANRQLADANQALADAMNKAGDAGVSGGGGVDQFAEALANLSPNAREFVLAIQALGGAFKELKFAVQDSLFNGLGETLTTGFFSVFDVLKTGLVGVGDEINRGVKDAITTLTSPAAVADFTTTMQGVKGLFAGLADSAAPLSQIWIDLSTVSAPYIDRWGQSIARTTQRWSDSVRQAREDGSLNTLIDQAIQSWQYLGDFLGNLGGSIAGVWRAANDAGQPLLQTMDDAVTRWHEFTDSTEGHNQLVTMFQQAGEALGVLMDWAGKLGNIFTSDVIPMVNSFLQGAGPGVSDFIGSLKSAMESMKPAMKPLGTIVGGIAKGVGKMIETFAPLISLIIRALAPVISRLAPLLIPLIGGFGGVARGGMLAFKGLSKLRPVFSFLHKWGGKLFTVLGKIGKKALPVLEKAGVKTGGVMSKFHGIIRKVGDVISKKVIPPFRFLIDHVKKLFGWFKKVGNGAKEGGKKLGNVFKNLKDVVGNAMKGCEEWLKGAGRKLVNGLIDGAKKAWETGKNFFNDLRTGASGGSVTISGRANGAVSSQAVGSVRAYAGGGVNRLSQLAPQIFAGGSWVVAAEDETEGESFIPHAKSKRRRSTQILAETARLFGLSVVDGAGNPVRRDGSSVTPTSTTYFADGAFRSPVSVEDIDNFARGVDGVGYLLGGDGWGDCSRTVGIIVNYAHTGVKRLDRIFSTVNEGQVLDSLGYFPGPGEPGDMRIGWFDHGGGAQGHTAMTVPSGTNVEMSPPKGRFGGGANGATSSMFDQHRHLPGSYFKRIEVPAIGDPFTGIQSSVGLPGAGGKDALDSATYATGAKPVDPDALAAEDNATEDNPTTITGAIMNIVGAVVKGHVQDVLNFVGMSDEFPPAVKAFMQYQKQLETAHGTKPTSSFSADKSISEVASAATDVIKRNPGMPTMEVTGAQLVGQDTGFSELAPAKPNPGDFGNMVYDPAGGAEQWRPMAMAAMTRNGFNANDRAQVDAMIKQIQTESGGNPGIAQQIHDVNGTGESAGVGLLQIIPATFAANRDPELPNDRRDPWANMNAALRYYKGRYGGNLTTVWGQGHGYADGGDVWGAGGPRADLIPALLSNGEHVTNAESANLARPLLHAINENPTFADTINRAFTGSTTPPTSPGDVINVHYHIETNNLDEGLRRADLHARQQVAALAGAR